MKDTIKGFILGVVACATVLGSAALAANNEIRTLTAEFCGISIDIDQRQLIPKDTTGREVEPFIVDGTTYLPVRAIAEACNKEVAWDDETKKVSIFAKSEPLTEGEVQKAFEEDYLKSKTISQVTMTDGKKTPPNSETLEDYKIVRVERASGLQNPNVWIVKYDVKPKHNPDAEIDPSKSPYMYGWVAGNGVIEGDWVKGKSLYVYVVKVDGVVKLDVIGTGL